MLGSTLVVVADAHLGAAAPAVTEGFLAFLARVPALGDALLVNGDLFDFWFSYRHVVPREGFAVAAALAQLGRAGIRIAMVGGNHDRWGDDFWQRDAGLAFDRHRLRFGVGRRTVLAVHGDGLTETRRRARLLNRVLASPVAEAAYRLIHPDLAVGLVRRLAPHLGDDPLPAPAILDEAQRRQESWAQAEFARDPALDTIVMGHTHRAAARELAPGKLYLNPGAWFDGFRYAVLRDDGATLHTFPA